MKAIGIDVGGTGVKGALVDVEQGAVLGERVRRPTPQPATRELLGAEIASMVEDLDSGDIVAVGVAFPAIVVDGVALTAGNVADEWMYSDLQTEFRTLLQRDTWVLNDGDAAGLAEVHFGAARDATGRVVMITLGTGIGTGLFIGGRLIPNIELGGLAVRGKIAGERAANSIRERRHLSWRRWAKDVELYVRAVDLATSPDLIVIGGGVSEDSHRFLPLISARPPIMPASLRNNAGIVGAAAYAATRRAIERRIRAPHLAALSACIEWMLPESTR